MVYRRRRHRRLHGLVLQGLGGGRGLRQRDDFLVKAVL